MEGMENDSFVDEIPQIVAQPTGATKRAKPGTGNSGSVANEMQLADDRDTRDWIDAVVGGEAPVKVNIYRKKPSLGANGENIGGSLETTEERIDDDYIRETWGGGDFRLSILTSRPNGQFKLFRSRSIKIGGPPKMSGQLITARNGNSPAIVIDDEKGGLAERAFETMERQAERAQDRLEKIEAAGRQSNGFDVAAFQAFNQPMIEQLKTAQAESAELRRELIALSNKAPPRDEFRDQMMTRMITGESDRLETLRAQYEARIDKMRDNHEDAIKRLEDRHVDEIRRLETRHQRELDSTTKAIEYQTKGSSIAYDTRIDALKSDIVRLQGELAARDTKMAALESRKDQTIGEKADELIKVKEALDGIGGGDGDKDEPWYERLVNAVGNSEAALAMISKFAGGQPATPQQQQHVQQQPQLPPPGVPFQTGDGNVYVRDQAGNVTIIDQQAMQRQRKLQQAQAARRDAKKKPSPAQNQNAIQPATPPDAGEDEDGDEDDTPGAEELALELNPSDVKIAISFMENAIKNNTPPEKFAQTARNLVPGDVLSFIAQHGIRKLFGLIKLDTGSPLTTVAGRQFADRVAKVLVGDPA